MTKSLSSRAARFWCALMHSQPMWPLHGYYRCSTCLRMYPVPWASSEPGMGSAVPQIDSFGLAELACAGSRRRN